MEHKFGCATLALMIGLAFCAPEAVAQGVHAKPSGVTQVTPTAASQQKLQAAAPPLGGANITVNSPAAGQQNETSIAINLNSPSNLLGGANDYRNGDSACGRYFTTDNGRTWTDLGTFPMFTAASDPTNTAFTTAGDPGVAFDANGHAYYLCMYFTRSPGNDATQFVHKSLDGGATWGPPVQVRAGNARADFDDKGHIAVDNKSFTANRGNVYVAWARLNTNELRFARSTDGAATFIDDQVVATGALTGANITVGIDGSVYVSWLDEGSNQINVAKSTNGGQSFGAATTIRSLTPIGSVRPLTRVNSFPVGAADAFNANILYAIWSEDPTGNDDSDIMFSRSTNGGSAWSSPIRVNDDINPNGDFNSQFFPWMAVDPVDGSINAIWFDDRLDPNHTDGTPLVDQFFASSTDGGLSFSVNKRITTQSSDTTVGFGSGANQFFGDYNAITAFGGVAYPLWTDSRNGTQDVMTTEIGGADLAITKTASATTVSAGGQLLYTINVTNNGPAAAFNVVVTDTLPSATVYLSDTDSCTQAPTGTLTCQVGSLGAGKSTSFNIQVQVSASAPANSTLTNTAVAASDEQDPDSSNNTATAAVTVTAQADLQVMKVCKPDSPAQAGSNALCTITVTNNGPSDAQNVTLNDNIVASSPFQITSVSPSVGTCTFPPGVVTTAKVACNLGTLAGGASATVTVNFTSTGASDINDTATVSSTTPDPNTANNSATGHVSFVAGADLSISKTGLPNPVVAGTNLTYTITVNNAGPSTATGVVVKDTIPGQVSVLSVSPGTGSCTAGIPGNPLQPLTCTLGNLAPAGVVTINVVVAVSSSVPNGTVLNNNATVGSAVNDPNNSNNSATAAVTVQARADLAITKTSDKSVYKPSSVITYTVSVTNNGPSDALAVIVTDNLPTTMQSIYQSDTGGCTKSGLVLTCNLGNMPVGTTKSFLIRELVKGSRGPVTDTTSVISSTTDPVSANNTSSLTVIIGH